MSTPCFTEQHQKNSNAFSQFRTNLPNSYSQPRDVTALLLCYTHCTGYPFVERIFFKLYLYVYKSLNGHAPQYLTDSLNLNPDHHRDQSLILHLITPFSSFHLPEHKMGIKLLLSQGLPYGTLFHATTLQILTVSKKSWKRISSHLSSFFLALYLLLMLLCRFSCCAAIMFLESVHYKFWLLCYVMLCYGLWAKCTQLWALNRLALLVFFFFFYSHQK